MKLYQKILLAVFLLLIAAIISLLIIRYVIYSRNESPYKTFALPRLELSEVEVTLLEKQKTKLLTTLTFTNPLPFALTADSIGYEMYIHKTKVLESSYPERFSIARGESSVQAPVTVYNEKLVDVLKKAEQEERDSVEYELNATLYTGIKNFHIDVKRTLPLVYIPEVKLSNVEIDTLRLSHANLLLHVSVNNSNVFAIEAKEVSYRFLLEGNKWFSGKKGGLVNIPAKSTAEIILPLDVSFKEAGASLLDLLVHGTGARYKMTLRFKLNAEKNFLRDSRIIINSEGTVKSIIKLR